MAILIVLQDPGLANEIASSLRRGGRVAKVCPSVSGSDFLKEFVGAELVITDVVPPVLRFLTAGGKSLLSSAKPLLVISSRGHCGSFASMLRSQDRCLALDGAPQFIDLVRDTAQQLIVPSVAPVDVSGVAGVAPEARLAKRISADPAHEHRVDRADRKVLSRQVRFVSDIAHDLRTPLTAIGEFAGLMRSGLSGSMTDQQQRYMGIIERCCGEAARMVYDLLDGARLQSGHIHPHRQPADLQSIFADVLESLEPAIRHGGIELKSEIPDGLARLFADRDMLGRIIVNLVSNAIKFSPPNGTVTMRSERFSVSMARISVIDRGRGISSQDLRRIFHRFEQGSNCAPHGIGLGLSIVRELVKLHGGRVTVESTPGRGSRFHFTVPLFLPTAILRRHLAAAARGTGIPPRSWAFTFHDSSKYDAVHRLISATVRAHDLVLPDESRRHILLVTQSKRPDRLIARILQQIGAHVVPAPEVAPIARADLSDWLASTLSRTPLPLVLPKPAQLAG